MALLEARGLTKRFDGLTAVNTFDITVEKGKIVGLIGPNGAGKTTAFNLISGFLDPTEGDVYFDGEDITNLRPDQVCKRGLARTFQVVKPFVQLSVRENIMVGAYNRTNSKDRALHRADEIINFLGLEKVADESAGSLSVAYRKRLELAKTLATEPKIILLDEAMAGLRPKETDEIIELVRQINQRGISLLIVEHVMKVIMALAEHIVVIHHGEKLAEGKPKDIAQNQDVIDAYLGEENVYVED
jgi:branched-chain amino acid transport system ATP-binding protein